MTNFRTETVAHVVAVSERKMNEVKCALILEDNWVESEGESTHVLKVGYNHADYIAFLESIDKEYDSGYGTQRFSGTIWYEDGTWSERREYDGSEWWVHCYCPSLPEEVL